MSRTLSGILSRAFTAIRYKLESSRRCYIVFEDASDLILPAVRLLESKRQALGCPDLKIWSLTEFDKFARSHSLTRNEKEIIVDQAILLIDQFYAHLPFKRARYAADPVQSLRLIRAQLDELSDIAFHDQLIRTLVGLRDAHTFYALPDPYQAAFAFLPFRMQCFYEASGRHRHPERRYMVTHVLDGFEHKLFTKRAEITSWNGVAIDQAVEREGQSDPGANSSSRFARSINTMCTRVLALSLPPPESFVVVGYKPVQHPADELGIVMPWSICTNGIVVRKRKAAKSSINEVMAQVSIARKVLFHRQELMDRTAQPSSAKSQPSANSTKYPDVFSFQYSGGPQADNPQADNVDPSVLRDPAHPDQKFGYLRIKTFDLDEAHASGADKFVEEFQRIVTIMQDQAPDGLILDVRSNPGGSIEAAERILQMLTPKAIEPARFHFTSTVTTQRIAALLSRNGSGVAAPATRQWLPWVQDLLSSVTSGSIMTAGQPLTDPDDANDTGQIYQGPVVLIIDALAYSATDIFAAGFQDHKIGLIIGVDKNTGGGGANRWLHSELLDHLKIPGLHQLAANKLPRGAEFGLAIRRSSRVADNAGMPVEDDGVKADITYPVTSGDLLNNDHGLFAFACAKLAERKTYRLKIDKVEPTPDGIDVWVSTRNLFRMECVINSYFTQCSVPITGAQQSFHIPNTGLFKPAERLQINGFAPVAGLAGVTSLQLVATAISLFENAVAQTTEAVGTAIAG